MADIPEYANRDDDAPWRISAKTAVVKTSRIRQEFREQTRNAQGSGRKGLRRIFASELYESGDGEISICYHKKTIICCHENKNAIGLIY